MNSKGAFQQIFLIIMTVFIMGIIILFGADAISTFIKQGETAEMVKFKNSLEREIKSIYSDFGSVRLISFNVPAGYEKICFIKAGGDNYVGLDSESLSAYSYAKDEEFSDYESLPQNVFLEPIKGNEIPIKVTEIDFDGGAFFLCKDILNGKVDLRLEGTGRSTKLS